MAEPRDAWDPAQYEKFKRERAEPFYDLLELIDCQKPPHCTIDLGCGTGELTQVLHEKSRAKETLGIDNSPAMIAQALTRRSEGLTFADHPIERFPTATEAPYDLIFSNAALQWCEDHATLFARLRRALAPGGQLAIQMPMNHDYPTHRLARAMASESPYREWLSEASERAYPRLSSEDYASLLFRLGFREQKVMLKVYGHVLESREAVIEWVKGTLLTHFQSQLTAERYAQLLSEFRARLFQEIADDRPFFYPFKRLLLWARL